VRRVALLLTLALTGALGHPASAQPDTAPDTVVTPLVVVDTTEALLPLAPLPLAPRTALRRSLIVPGWGQVSNGDYVKAGVAAAAVGGLVTLAVVNQLRTVRYRRAAIFADCNSDTVELPAGTCDDFEAFEDEWRAVGMLPAASSRALRDTSRRNRDFSILLSSLAYALQALDAYVSAQLADFDVSEDLSIHLAPTPTGVTAALRWKL
jgi:hypothetical protein